MGPHQKEIIKMVEKEEIKQGKKIDSKKTSVQPAPQNSSAICEDKKCAIHGDVSTRGRVFTGRVISAKMHGTATVEWPRLFFIPKYERFEKRRSRVKAHNPTCLNVKEGDVVKIAECRPLAKTVKFVVIEKLGFSGTSEGTRVVIEKLGATK